jgi:hypothetical protein
MPKEGSPPEGGLIEFSRVCSLEIVGIVFLDCIKTVDLLAEFFIVTSFIEASKPLAQQAQSLSDRLWGPKYGRAGLAASVAQVWSR